MAKAVKKTSTTPSVSKRESKITFIYSSPEVTSPQDEIKSRQQDGLEIYSVLGANLDERDFFERWERLGQALSPTELAGVDDKKKKEIELSRKKEAEIKEKIGSICFRLRFIKSLQYDNPFTERNDRYQSDALQIYLLCTCFDTLAGQSSHKRFDVWAREKDDDSLQSNPKPESNQELAIWYKLTTKRLFEEYLDDYGVVRNFRRMFNELPDVLQHALTDSFTVIRENETTEHWNELPPDKKLRRIVDYLFARRNKFTHNSDIVPTSGSKEDFHLIEIDGKKYKVSIDDVDETRDERTLLMFVLIGALRTLLGYQIDELFSKLYWFIEKHKAQFREILNELRRNYSLRSWYLSNPPVDLAKAPSSYRLRYFSTGTIEALLDAEINLDWFFGTPDSPVNKDIRKDLNKYTRQIQMFNRLLRKYESQSRKPRAQEKTKRAAYETFCQRLQSVSLNTFTEDTMGDFYFLLSNAPQIPTDAFI